MSQEISGDGALIFLAGALGVEDWHSQFVGDLLKFFAGDGVEGLATALEMLVHFDSFLLHHAVRLLAAADELEICARGDARVTVLVVQSQTEQPRFLL